jgi:hypothetical protein
VPIRPLTQPLVRHGNSAKITRGDKHAADLDVARALQFKGNGGGFHQGEFDKSGPASMSTDANSTSEADPGRAPANSDAVFLEEHIVRFQKRAMVHFRTSHLFLAGIVLLFGLAIYVFLFAQDIDKSKGSIQVMQELQVGKSSEMLLVEAAKREADILTNRFQLGDTSASAALNAKLAFNEARTKLNLINEQIRLMNESGYVADIDRPRSKEELIIIAGGKKEALLDVEALSEVVRRQAGLGVVGGAEVSQADRLRSQAEFDKAVAEQRAKVALPAAELRNVASNLDTIDLVRTSLIRFGGVAVILFLASLLIPIYRYNMRLGTFFQARADTLWLCRDMHVRDFAEMIRLLTPAYTFEKEPKTPIESIASLAKDVGAIIKKS